MKLNVHIDEEEMSIMIKESVSKLTSEYLHIMILGVVSVIVVLILTSFCGSALAIYCCKKCRLRRRVRKQTQSVSLKHKTQYTNTEGEAFI